MTNFDTNIVVMQSILISQDSTRTDGMYGVNFGVKNIWNTSKVLSSKWELVYLLSWHFCLVFFCWHLTTCLHILIFSSIYQSDDRTLRLSKVAEWDLTPLIHFWGIHPEDPVALKGKNFVSLLLLVVSVIWFHFY